MKSLWVLVVAVLMMSFNNGVYAQNATGTVTVSNVDIGYTTVFTDEAFPVTVGVEFDNATDAQEEATWKAFINGQLADSGAVNVTESNGDSGYSFELSLVTSESGHTNVDVEVCIQADSNCGTGSSSVQAIGAGVSLIPLIIIVILAMWTKHVEISLAIGVFVGACIVNGNMVIGFNRFLDTYILNAVTSGSHQMVILFTFFISGLVGMIEKAGGIRGMTEVLLKYATTRRRTQLVALLAGLLIFFDDYSNCLVVGFSMRSLFDPSQLSREKLAFITDATSAPIASLTPISSWVGFELDQIQKQLDAIAEENGGTMPDGLSGSAFTIFIESIPYRYYPLLMLFFQLALVVAKREFGPMLIAERICRVYSRTDGGPGAFKGDVGLEDSNRPVPGTPFRAWNMLVPVLSLIVLILVVMINLGIDNAAAEGIDSPSVQQIFELTDSYQGLLVGSFGASCVTILFYAIQFKNNGKMVMPTFKAFFRSNTPKELHSAHQVTESLIQDVHVDEVTRPIMGVMDSVEAWLKGIQRVFPAILVLVLAWATGGIMADSGANRFFQDLIESNLSPESLPTMTFVISSLMALATGTSWGTMEVVFPIVVVPAWNLSNSPDLVVAVIAAVLSGAVAGDHISFISDTTVLSSIAAGCDLTRHVITQAPYALVVALWSILAGTLPIGLYCVGEGGYSNPAALGIGALLILITIFGLGRHVVNSTGSYDPITEFYLFCRKAIFKSPDMELEQLRNDTKSFAAGPKESPAEIANEESSDSDECSEPDSTLKQVDAAPEAVDSV